ncbi:MAG: hypothetical protein L0177_05955 [Chloroflexi bacterium]|nr:hypothetical protein [Chloroflexota bacterium]
MLKKISAALLVMALAALSANTALAHERRDVGEYSFVVGFIVEPAFEGLKNGLDIRVTEAHHEEAGAPGTSGPAPVAGHTHEEESEPTPVEGLQDTLQAELTHVASGASRIMALRTIFRDPGHYTADLIPTSSGVYEIRIFGTIEGTPVDETFISRGGGGDFGDIEPSADLQFPESVPAARELESAVRGAQTSVQAAQTTASDASDSASTATMLGIVGIVLGAVGIASGGGAAFMAMRSKRG